MVKYTLYKRNVNGSINQWTIIIEDDGYYTEYGIVNGKMTTSDKVFVKPKNVGKKNETTIQEQSVNEAMAIIAKKKKSENFVDNYNDVDKITFSPPMLASVYSKYTDKIKFCQPKLDGIRCNMCFSDGKILALSRKNNEFYTVDHIKDKLYDILSKHQSIHIDGELYNHTLHDDFNKIVSLVKKEKVSDKDRSEIEKYVRYNIYDIWDDNNPDMLFEDRFNIILQLFGNIEYIDIVPTNKITDEDSLEKNMDLYLADGYEGLILRLNEPYEHKRSKNLLKYKKFQDDDFLIIDICEGVVKGHAEYVVVQLQNDTCKATIAATDEECSKMLSNKDYIIGKYGTVKYFGYTKDGKLRFPILKSIRDYE
jgi:ATP-dependent DNA ligase